MPSAPPTASASGGGASRLAGSLIPGGENGRRRSARQLAACVRCTYTFTGQQTQPALIAAVALGAFLGITRVVRKQTAQLRSPASSASPSPYVVWRTGRAEDFFLPGLLANSGYALASAISIAVRWPLFGVFIAIASNRGMEWRHDPARVRAYSRASWVWVVLFSLRLAVQLPLYLTGAVVALGAARVAMGVPLFVVGIWLSWLILRTRQHD